MYLMFGWLINPSTKGHIVKHHTCSDCNEYIVRRTVESGGTIIKFQVYVTHY